MLTSCWFKALSLSSRRDASSLSFEFSLRVLVWSCMTWLSSSMSWWLALRRWRTWAQSSSSWRCFRMRDRRADSRLDIILLFFLSSACWLCWCSSASSEVELHGRLKGFGMMKSWIECMDWGPKKLVFMAAMLMVKWGWYGGKVMGAIHGCCMAGVRVRVFLFFLSWSWLKMVECKRERTLGEGEWRGKRRRVIYSVGKKKSLFIWLWDRT